jgi:transposase InsO family protein
MRREDEDQLTQAIIQLASQYRRYGYRRITALLRHAGWQVGKDRVERIWRREGLEVPQKQKPRGRLWLNDGSCIRLRPEHRNHVWSCDFVSARTHDGRTLRMLNLIDEYNRECLAIRVARRLNSNDVIDTFSDAMILHGVPEHILSDNGPELVAKNLRMWLQATGAKTLYIEPGSPWENGYCESFNSKLRDELLNGAGTMLVYGALSSHRQTDPAKFLMPLFAPRLIYSTATVRGWWLPRWVPSQPLAEVRAATSDLLTMLAKGPLTPPATVRYPLKDFQEAVRLADGEAGQEKVLLDFSD